MNIDLELILSVGVVVTGAVWLADRLFLAEWRTNHQSNTKHYSPGGVVADVHDHSQTEAEPWYVEYSKSFFPVLLIVLLLRSFVAEPFRIPSGSMMPTLLVGDFILVNKYAYGIRLPVLKTKLINVGEPQRGDVVVFRFPRNPSDDYIKRIVGLPGDHIAYYNKSVYVNGQRVKQDTIGIYKGVGSGSIMSDAILRQESLGKIRHDILIKEDRLNMDGEFIVPPGHYFVLGDNRDNSNDSRYWGFVPEENLVGRAVMIWLNLDFQGGTYDFSRIGERII